jgi:hypothetical protein
MSRGTVRPMPGAGRVGRWLDGRRPACRRRAGCTSGSTRLPAWAARWPARWRCWMGWRRAPRWRWPRRRCRPGVGEVVRRERAGRGGVTDPGVAVSAVWGGSGGGLRGSAWVRPVWPDLAGRRGRGAAAAAGLRRRHASPAGGPVTPGGADSADSAPRVLPGRARPDSPPRSAAARRPEPGPARPRAAAQCLPARRRDGCYGAPVRLTTRPGGETSGDSRQLLRPAGTVTPDSGSGESRGGARWRRCR